MAAVRDQAEAAAELEPQRAERLPRGRRLVGDDQQQVAADASSRALIAAISCSERNFAIGERQPSGS